MRGQGFGHAQRPGRPGNAECFNDARFHCRILPFLRSTTSPSSSAPQEAKGVARRICEDPPAAGVDVEQSGTEAEDLLLSLVKVRDIEIQMKLLRVRAVRPPRRSVILHALERKYQARARAKGRKVIADCPPGVRPVDHAAKERLVEPGEFKDIRTV
jgi:hypothetical protein